MPKKKIDDTSNHLSIGGGLSGELIEVKSNTDKKSQNQNQKQIIKQQSLNNQNNEGSGNISNTGTY